PRFLRVTLHNNAKGTLGLNNEGFRKMGIKEKMGYDFSLMYRTSSSNIRLHVELINDAGGSIGGTSVTTSPSGDAWKKISSSFTATATVANAKLNIWFEG